jgi:hypothetical protein
VPAPTIASSKATNGSTALTARRVVAMLTTLRAGVALGPSEGCGRVARGRSFRRPLRPTPSTPTPSSPNICHSITPALPRGKARVADAWPVAGFEAAFSLWRPTEGGGRRAPQKYCRRLGQCPRLALDGFAGTGRPTGAPWSPPHGALPASTRWRMVVCDVEETGDSRRGVALPR